MEEKKIENKQGWKDVIINPNMPLNMIIQFINSLNQRICFLEDNLKIELKDRPDEAVTITEFYDIMQERAAAEEKNKSNESNN